MDLLCKICLSSDATSSVVTETALTGCIRLHSFYPSAQILSTGQWSFAFSRPTVWTSLLPALCYNSLSLNRQTDTHPFNGLFSRTTWVSQYQKS